MIHLRLHRQPRTAPKEPPFWWTLLLYVALFVASELLRPKPEIEDARPAGLGDFNFPTATEGRVVPLIWGTVLLKGPNVLWYGDLFREPIKEKVKTGLLSSENVIVGYRYRVGVQFGLCRGPIDAVLKVLIGDKEAFSGSVADGGVIDIDDPEFFGGDEEGNGGVEYHMKVFAGTETQLASSYLNSVSLIGMAVSAGGSGYAVDNIVTVSGGVGTAATARVKSIGGGGTVTAVEMLNRGVYSILPASPANTTGGAGSGLTLALTFGSRFQQQDGDTPGYRGTCHLLPVSAPFYVGNSSNVKPISFEVQRIPNGLGLTAGKHIVNGRDANPANVIYEWMTNNDWGLAFSASDIDLASFQAAGNTLYDEGNGFSFVLDREMQGIDFLREVERQIDGVVFYDQLTGKWRITLARGGYDINTVPQITQASRTTLKSFARGSWRDTTNIVRVEFFDPTDEYKQTYALAQDLANIRIQGGANVSITTSYLGVKNAALANQLAWRDLRSLAYPLAKATVVVDRTFFNVHPGDVVAFTDTTKGLVKLPMRVQRVNLGRLYQDEVELDLIQDVDYFAIGSFGNPTNTGWGEPTQELLPFISSEQRAFEAPRGFTTRDPRGNGEPSIRVWAGARRRRQETGFEFRERHAVGTPAGSFAVAGRGFQLLLLGELTSSLAVGSATPLATLLISPNADTQATLEEFFTDETPGNLGTRLVNMVLVDDEFMLVASAQTSGGNVQLNNVYRGVMDSVQAAHPSASKVWLLLGAITDVTFPESFNVDVKLLPFAGDQLVPEGDATTIAVALDKRARRPYAPSKISLNGVAFDTTSVSLEGGGSAPEDFSIVALFNRRDYRTADEVASLLADAAALDASFPAANSTVVKVEVRNDPAGANTFLFFQSGAGPTLNIKRIDILLATDGVLPANLRFISRATHTDAAESLDSRYGLQLDFSVASALSGQFNFGALDTNDVSNLYTATQNGTYNFTLSSAFTAGAVEYRLNAGAWTTLIAAGNTTGSIAGVVATDTIEVRHASTDTGAKKQLSMDAPSSGQDAYAILFV